MIDQVSLCYDVDRLCSKEIINTLGLYSALRACSAIVLRSRRQSRFTVATMFLASINVPAANNKQTMGNTHCSVGTIPLTP